MKSGNLSRVRKAREGLQGATLIELMVVVIIVGILAAVAIPVFTDYLRESRLSEASTNIQGILEAEQAYFIRFQRYTPALGFCPGNLATDSWSTQIWPKAEDYPTECNTPAGSALGWSMLGWRPDGPVYFRYRIFSHNTGLETCAGTANQCPSGGCCQTCGDPSAVPPTSDQDCVDIGLGLAPADSGLGTNADLAGIQWNQEGFAGGNIAPWCVVEAEADMDLDGASVFIRGNSYNHRIYRDPNLDVNDTETW